MRRFTIYQARPIEDTSAPELYAVAVFDEAGHMVYSGVVPAEATGLVREMVESDHSELAGISRLFEQSIEWPKFTGEHFRECFTRCFVLIQALVALHVHRGGQPIMDLPRFDADFWRDALK